MAHGRQSSEWAQTLAIMKGLANVFADRASQQPIRDLIPEHLLSCENEATEDADEIKANWDDFKSLGKKLKAKRK